MSATGTLCFSTMLGLLLMVCADLAGADSRSVIPYTAAGNVSKATCIDRRMQPLCNGNRWHSHVPGSRLSEDHGAWD